MRLRASLLTAAPIAAVLILAAAVPAHGAPTGVVDPPTTAVGATAPPETGWLAAVRPCTHYVDAAATAPFDGSSARPWKTLGQAMAGLAPGQTGCIRPGTYAEASLRPARSGTAAAPIALRAQGAVTIVPTAPPTPEHTFLLDSAAGTLAYWLVEGVTIDKQGQDGVGFYFVTSGSGVVRAVAVRNTVIRNGTLAGIVVRGRVTDVLLEGNEITGFARWTSGTNISHVQQPGYGRADANALSIEGTGGTTASVERVLARRNSFHDNGGDGVQCLTDNDAAGGAVRAGDPKDIDLVDNRMVNTPGSAPIEENAVDIKSCQRVSIRGTDPPTGSGAAVQWNKFAEYLPTRKDVDASNGGNTSNGDAVVMHYRADQILVENLRIWNACAGFSLGRGEAVVRDITIRRVLVFGLRYGQAPPGGTAQDGARCRGVGFQATNTTHVDLYHLTLDGVPGYAVLLSSNFGPVTDVDLWNSIIRLRVQSGALPKWVHLTTGLALDTIDSNRNVFWHPDGSPTGAYFSHDGVAMTFATWQSLGRDAASYRADPQLWRTRRRTTT